MRATPPHSYLDRNGAQHILPSFDEEEFAMPAPVIVVHDDPGTRELAVSALCAAGLQAVGFDDLIEALTAVEADTRMRVLVPRVNFGPGKLNGAALARMLRLRRRDVKTVFVASLQDRVYVDGQGEFIPMPLDAPVLVDTVARLLTGQGQTDGEVPPAS